MIREFVVHFAETMFVLMSGVPLHASPWILFWIFGWTMLVTLSIVVALVVISRYSPKLLISLYTYIVTPIVFVACLLIVTAVPTAQLQMMKECKTVTADVTVGEITAQTDVQQCRFKPNYYEDFGEWQLRGIRK
jgi:hypothetical protein